MSSHVLSIINYAKAFGSAEAQTVQEQNVTVTIALVETKPGPIGRSVRQGCLLLPILFNIHAEAAVRQDLDSAGDGVEVVGA